MVFALILGEILNVSTGMSLSLLSIHNFRGLITASIYNQVFTIIGDDEKFKKEALFWSLMFLAFGGGSFFTQLFQVCRWSVSSII